MITIKQSFQNKETTVCLLLENSKKLYHSNLDEKKVTDIKLFGRPLNRSYPIKLCQERKQVEGSN